MIEALVFDFDGLIVDTEWPSYEAWRSVFADHGADLPLSDFVQCIGTRGAIDWGMLLASKTGKAGPSDQALRDVKHPRELARIGELPLLPGIRDWLDAALAAGLPCAIASSSERHWVVPHLDRLGISHHFGAIATWEGSDCGYPPKPAPHVYRHACTTLDVAPRASIAFEDSPNGVAAAKAAGLFCVAVPNRVTTELDFRAADIVVASLAEFTLADALVIVS